MYKRQGVGILHILGFVIRLPEQRAQSAVGDDRLQIQVQQFAAAHRHTRPGGVLPEVGSRQGILPLRFWQMDVQEYHPKGALPMADLQRFSPLGHVKEDCLLYTSRCV